MGHTTFLEETKQNTNLLFHLYSVSWQVCTDSIEQVTQDRNLGSSKMSPLYMVLQLWLDTQWVLFIVTPHSSGFGVVVLLVSRPRDVAKENSYLHPPQAPTMNYLAQNVNNAETEKLWPSSTF